MLVLVTRPREQAEKTASLLRAAGYEVLLDPMLAVGGLPPPTFVPGEVAAVAVTSANAAPAVTAVPVDLPVFAVGEATARAIRAVGREPVGVAGGDGRALAGLIARAIAPGGTILHLCGREVREGLAEALATAGLAYRAAVVYEAVAAADLAPATAAAIREHRLNAVLFYSPRSAALFGAQVRAAGLERGLATVIAVCLSDAVAAELAGLKFREIRVAAARDQKALLRRLEG
jgi:uroporphyrinogen-III synthase